MTGATLPIPHIPTGLFQFLSMFPAEFMVDFSAFVLGKVCRMRELYKLERKTVFEEVGDVKIEVTTWLANSFL